MDDPELRSLLAQRLGRRQLIGLDASVALAYAFVMTVLTTRSDSADTAPAGGIANALMSNPFGGLPRYEE